MAALPYIQLYIADYLADTMHLTTEEHGAYLLIIFNYWQTGKPVPKNRLARIARLSNERWISVESSLAEFFNDDGEFWSHKRIDTDLEFVNKSLSQKSLAGKASAEARKREKLAKEQQKANGRSTSVEIPLKQQPSEASTIKDTDTDTDTDINTDTFNDASTSDAPNAQMPILEFPSEKQKPAKPDYPDWFENLWQHYPPRSGGNDKRKALHAAQARVKSGKDPDYLLSAVLRYSDFVRANGNWGTQYVMQAATFFGPGEHIDNPWRIQHAANQPGYRPSNHSGGGLSHDDVTWAEGIFPGISDYSRTAGEQPAVAIEGDFSRVVGGHQG